MDWQQLVSLTIVSAAAVLLLRARFRPRKFSFQRDTHCGVALMPTPCPNTPLFSAPAKANVRKS